MFGLGNGSESPVYGVLVDVGSSSVGVAIVASHQNRKLPVLVYTHRVNMRVSGRTPSRQQSLIKVREALFSASLTLSQNGFETLRAYDPAAQISKLYIACSSPWAFTVSQTIEYKEDEQFKITQSLIDSLIQGAEEEMLNQIATHESIDKSQLKLVEQTTVNAAVNDYPVKSPINMKGNTFTLSHVAGFISEDVLSLIRDMQDKLFPNTESRTNTNMLVMYCVLRELFPRKPALCIIDITGDSTEFGVVENSVLLENTFVAYGSSTFIRDVMGKTEKSVTDIQSSIQAFGDDTALLPPEFEEQMQVYEKSVTESLQEILSRRMLPGEVVVTVPQQYEKLFKQMIERAFQEAIKRKPAVVTIDPRVVQEISEGEDGDLYLALGARFFHKLHGCGELNSA